MPSARARFALFAYGFRPFFLAAGLSAVLTVPAWLLMLGHGSLPLGALPPPLWHAHELFYGFVGAALAGFLLTAVPSWTGARGFAGWPLAAAASTWLLGRLAFAFARSLPSWALAAAELAFLPVVALLLAPPLLRSRNRNTPLLLVIALLWLTDAAFVTGLARQDPLLAGDSLRVAIDLMLVVLTLIGGRIVPSFTANALRRRGEAPTIRSFAWLERTVMPLMIAVVAIDLWQPEGAAAGWLAAVVAIAHGVRLSGWRSLRTRGEAILWALHVGYAWLPLGFALKALWLLAGTEWAAHWVHALTMGAFGTMILAVMTRAALGHTGRELAVGRTIAAAYALVTLAAVTRVFATGLWPSYAFWIVIASGLLWTAAFAAYLVVYAPILVLPRADGKPG
jgi:uncharacterized protein involved in response to NO